MWGFAGGGGGGGGGAGADASTWRALSALDWGIGSYDGRTYNASYLVNGLVTLGTPHVRLEDDEGRNRELPFSRNFKVSVGRCTCTFVVNVAVCLCFCSAEKQVVGRQTSDVVCCGSAVFTVTLDRSLKPVGVNLSVC